MNYVFRGKERGKKVTDVCGEGSIRYSPSRLGCEAWCEGGTKNVQKEEKKPREAASKMEVGCCGYPSLQPELYAGLKGSCRTSRTAACKWESEGKSCCPPTQLSNTQTVLYSNEPLVPTQHLLVIESVGSWSSSEYGLTKRL